MTRLEDTMEAMTENRRPNPIDLSVEPMRVQANQAETWTNFPEGGVSFYDAANVIMRAAESDGTKRDLGVGDFSTWAFGPAPDGTAALAPIPLPGRPSHLIPLRDHAFGQLCSRIGAPAAYIRKLPGKLQMACVNHGMRHEKETGRTIRMVGGEARAILSDRYAALDNEIVIETLERTLKAAGMLGDVRVRAVSTGPTCSMRLTFPGHDAIVQHSRQVNDIVEVGLDLLNGEIGNRSVSITPVTWRLVCLNGMRRADREVSSRLRHVGDPERLKEAFADAVPSALAASFGLRDQMGAAVERIVDDVLSEFDGLRAFGLNVAEAQDVARDVMSARGLALPSSTDGWADVVNDWRTDHELSAYDVLNGVTHVAQRKGTDRRIEMEEAASRYLHKRAA